MTETVTIDRAPVAQSKLAKVERRGKATVSASALAEHLDCSRQYVGKLEGEGVSHRDGKGFDLDASRVSYLRFLRREKRLSPRSEADADFQRAKAELIRLPIAEKQRDMIAISESLEVTDRICGVMLTALSSMPARCAGHDLALRRRIEQCVREVRTEISEAASALADERGEPAESRRLGESLCAQANTADLTIT